MSSDDDNENNQSFESIRAPTRHDVRFKLDRVARFDNKGTRIQQRWTSLDVDMQIYLIEEENGQPWNIIRPWTPWRFNDHQDLLCVCIQNNCEEDSKVHVQAIRHSFTYLVIFSLRHYRGGWQRRVRVCGSMWRNQSPGWWWRRMQGMRRASCTYWGVCKLQYVQYVWSFKSRCYFYLKFQRCCIWNQNVRWDGI